MPVLTKKKERIHDTQLMTLRKAAYRILKSGDKKQLENCVSLGGNMVTYKEILDTWKKELESGAPCCPVPTFLSRLGVDYVCNGGPRDGSEATISCPIDFTLLGLDPKKIPDLSHLKFLNTKKKDLDEVWGKKIANSLNHKLDPDYVDWVKIGEKKGPIAVIDGKEYWGGFTPAYVPLSHLKSKGLRKTLKKGSEATVSTKRKSRSR